MTVSEEPREDQRLILEPLGMDINSLQLSTYLNKEVRLYLLDILFEDHKGIMLFREYNEI